MDSAGVTVPEVEPERAWYVAIALAEPPGRGILSTILLEAEALAKAGLLTPDLRSRTERGDAALAALAMLLEEHER